MRKAIFTILMIVLFGGLWFAAHSWSKNLEVLKVYVYGTNYIDHDEILELVALPDGILFEDINLGEIRQRVERHPYVRTASVNRDFPSAIRVSIRERTPSALLVGSRMAVIDEENIVIPVRHGEPLRNLSIVSGSFRIPQPGDTLRHASIDRALQVLRATRETDEVLHHLFSEIQILDDGSLVAYTTDNGVPVFIGKDVNAQKLIAFKEFWLQEVAPVGADQIQSIDIRFDGQIVTRWRTGR